MEYPVITEEFVRNKLPKRSEEDHKGTFGRIFLVCGSVGYTGAAALAALASVRTGTGLCYVAVPEPVYPIVAGKLTEPMVFPVPAKDGHISDSAVPALMQRLSSVNAAGLGPGLGNFPDIFTVCKAFLFQKEVPVVLDADGLNVFEAHIDVLQSHDCPLIITPHPGEFRRLGGNLSATREEAACALAKKLHCVCVLKGHNTVVTDGETVLINPTGNPGMATGGSGDVLTGIITALSGMGMPPLYAAACGAWIHGKAGDICKGKTGEFSLLPTDMISALCEILP